MKILKRFLQISIVVSLTLFSPVYTYAQSASSITAPHLTSLVGVFGTIIGLLYDFITLALFVILTINGFKYLFSGVNPDQKAAASKGLTYAFVGLFIIAISYIIVMFLVTTFVGPNFSKHIISGSTFSGSTLNFNIFFSSTR